MQWIKVLLLCNLLVGYDKGGREAPKQRLERARTRLAGADTPERRFYALGEAAKESFVAEKVEDAQKYAQELMALPPNFWGNREYGSALHDANLVLGRIAVRNGQIEDARRYLIAAGLSSGTPHMASCDPNLSLANDLLAKGKRRVVLEYLNLCRRFWRSNEGLLEKWNEEIKRGKTPDFGDQLTC